MKQVFGTRGDDTLIATARPNEILNGRAGDDTFLFFIGSGEYPQSDTFIGGRGDDTLRQDNIRVDDVDDFGRFSEGLTFDGGNGRDTVELEFRASPSDVSLKFRELGIRTTEVEVFDVTLWGTSLKGGTRNLDVVGTSDSEVFTLVLDRFNALNSTIQMKGGDDTVILSEFSNFDGARTVQGGRGDDRLVNEASGTGFALFGGAGSDTIVTNGAAHAERVKGGGGSDRVFLGVNSNSFEQDMVSGNAGNDTFVIDPLKEGFAGTMITDFRSRRDTIEFDNDSIAADDVVFVNRSEDVGRDFGTIYVDVSTGTIHHDRLVVLDLGGATVRPGDFESV